MSGLKVLLGSNLGTRIPAIFVETCDPDEWGLSQSQQAILKGPETEDCYWETWHEVLDGCSLKDEHGNEWHLYHDGDLWMYCPELMTDLEKTEFFNED